jgi:hypothetical protein
VGLVEVRASWPGHHVKLKKKNYHALSYILLKKKIELISEMQRSSEISEQFIIENFKFSLNKC